MYISGTFEDVPMGKQSWRDQEVGPETQQLRGGVFQLRGSVSDCETQCSPNDEPAELHGERSQSGCSSALL